MDTWRSWTWAIIGTGAVGGFYGGRLARAGCRVRFLLRSDAAYVLQHGLSIESRDGDFHLNPVEAYADCAAMPASDVAIVAWKTTHNHQLPAVLPSVVKPGGLVLMLQNGLGVEEDGAAAAPDCTVCGALAFICAHKAGPGRIHHFDYGRVTIGQHRSDGGPAGVTPAVAGLVEAFAAAGLSVAADPHLAAARWRKLCWNVPFNGLSVLLDTDTRALMADPAGRGLATVLMEEVAATAEACAAPLGEGLIGRMQADTEAMVPYAPSMKLDFDQGRPLEIEAIYSRPISAAEHRGVQVPAMRLLRDALVFLERHRRLDPGSEP